MPCIRSACADHSLHRMSSLEGRRVFITGAARGIGAALAQRLSERGARVALAGLEEDLLAETAARCGNAPWSLCDVTDRAQVEAAVNAAVTDLGGLDVVVANAGVAAQMPIIGGDPEVMERTIAVNVMGVYNTLRAAGPHISHPNGYALPISAGGAAGPHISHPNGYALPISSVGAVVQLPLMGAYSASKAAVEALGNTLRIELAPSGAKVGVAYFAELDTDMTSRGFGTDAAAVLQRRFKKIIRAAPLKGGIRPLGRGNERRSPPVAAPPPAGPLLPFPL